MQIMVFLFIVFGIMATLTTRGEDQGALDTARASAVARQMAHFHAEAVRKCVDASAAGTPCPAGAVVPAASPTMTSAAMSYTAQFQSAYNGNLLVTTWKPTGSLARSQGQAGGRVAAQLRQDSFNSVYAGAWMNGAINGVNYFTDRDNPAVVGSLQISVPAAFPGGINFTNGMPILASVVR